MPHFYTNLNYHLIFATQNRQPVLTADIRLRLYGSLSSIIKKRCKGIALEIGGVADHVHILTKLRQDHRLADDLRDLKANSSRWLSQTFAELRHFSWQTGYSAFTVSESQIEKVKAYIANQEEHHRKMSFREELMALLKANGIEFREEELEG